MGNADRRGVLPALRAPGRPLRIENRAVDPGNGPGDHRGRDAIRAIRSCDLRYSHADARIRAKRALGGESCTRWEMVRAAIELRYGHLLAAGRNRLYHRVSFGRRRGPETRLAAGMAGRRRISLAGAGAAGLDFRARPSG